MQTMRTYLQLKPGGCVGLGGEHDACQQKHLSKVDLRQTSHLHSSAYSETLSRTHNNLFFYLMQIIIAIPSN